MILTVMVMNPSDLSTLIRMMYIPEWLGLGKGHDSMMKIFFDGLETPHLS